MNPWHRAIGCAALGAVACAPHGDGGGASSAARPAGVVSFVSVSSDRVPDVGSLAAWKRSFITPGMSDAAVALAAWRSVVAFRHQDEPPREFLDETTHAHDPIKLFNVYGYSQCDCASASVMALARSAGLDARGRSLAAHSVAELSVGGRWQMFDGAYIDYFPRPDGSLAGVDDLVGAVTGWLAQNPAMAQADRAALARFAQGGGYAQGPDLLASCPFYDHDGLFPAKTQGWADSVIDYRVPSLPTEFGYVLGYQVNVQLRRGERLVRNWSNEGHHINDDLGIDCLSATDVPGQGDMVYSPAYGDIAPGRVGNGSMTWTLPLEGGEYRDGALAVENLVEPAPGVPGPRVQLRDHSQPGVLDLRMPSSYVYLGGAVTIGAQVAPGGAVTIEGSRNHGLDWELLAAITDSGVERVDLTRLARRLYDYRLRVTLVGRGTGLDSLAIANEIQHSQRALPALGPGDNRIHFGAGPAEGTITIEGAGDGSVIQNLTWQDLHPLVDHIADAPLRPDGPSGSLAFPVTTPGDLIRLRFGGFYRARDPADAWDFEVSVDGGASYTPVVHVAGPTDGAEQFVTFDRIPPGTRAALVRFAGRQREAANLFDFRIDADYAEPAGGFSPVRVTYVWEEGGVTHSDVHDATSGDETWIIHCDAAPKMKSLVVERLQ
jgi:hypothetical protein